MKKLTPAQLKSIESIASNTVFGVDLTIPGTRLDEQTMIDFDTKMATSENEVPPEWQERFAESKSWTWSCDHQRVTIAEVFPRVPLALNAPSNFLLCPKPAKNKNEEEGRCERECIRVRAGVFPPPRPPQPSY